MQDSLQYRMTKRKDRRCMHFKCIGKSVVYNLPIILIDNSQRLINKPLHFMPRETEAQERNNESKYTE